MKKILYKLFLISFSIIFSLIMIGTIFDNKSLSGNVQPIILITGFIVVTILLILIYKLIDKKISEDISLKKEIIIFGIIFIIISIVQLIIIKNLISYPGWDWNDLFANSRLYVIGETSKIDWAYFQEFPNNYGMLYFEIIIFKIINFLGLSSTKFTYALLATVFINVVLIDISIILTYLTARNLFNKKAAIYSLILVLFSSAFYYYLPVLYTDTTTMLFPILILFCYSLWEKKNNKSKFIDFIFLLIAFITMIGIKLKFTIVIMLIALIIDMILKYDIKKYLKPLLLLLISFLIFNFTFTVLEKNFSIFPFDISNNNKQIPYTHWIMMGMTERDSVVPGKKHIGWYNKDSYDYTRSFETTKERQTANIEKIKEQFEEYGVVGYTRFLYRKMLYTWSDGSYFAPVLLEGSFIKKEPTIISKLYNGKYKNISFTANTAFILFMYLFILIGAISSIKNKISRVTSCYIALFGVLIFFLIWESSSRYLINYVPIMIIGTIYGIIKISKPINYQNKKNNNIINEIKINSSIEVKNMNEKPILYIVVPCYNEEEVLEETTKRLKEKMKTLISKNVIDGKSKVMYVNDGSKDKTWELIEKINKKEKLFTGISLSRNRGHQNALIGGLMTAKNYADVVISMDADLQDDINAIEEMLEKYLNGNDIVYGVRSARKKDTWFKRFTAESFYKVMKSLGVDVVYNHADYRLTSKRVLEEFSNFKEVNLFLRGMFPLVGFKSDVVYYERNERFAGTSKYPLKKMLNFAWDGITSFSVKPLRYICVIGFLILFISICIMLYTLIQKIIGNTVDGWAFLSISIWFIGALQMISIGIIGEYLGKVYSETKQRPRYIISENLEENNLKKN